MIKVCEFCKVYAADRETDYSVDWVSECPACAVFRAVPAKVLHDGEDGDDRLYMGPAVLPPSTLRAAPRWQHGRAPNIRLYLLDMLKAYGASLHRRCLMRSVIYHSKPFPAESCAFWMSLDIPAVSSRPAAAAGGAA